MDDLFIEFVTGDIRNRGYFIPFPRFEGFVRANIGSVMYHSYYLYDRSMLDWHNERGTLKGYYGPRYPFRMIVDIDGQAGELARAAGATREIIQYMTEFCEISPNNVQPWFSGGKGFHIQMPNIFGLQAGAALPRTVRSTFEALFEKWGDWVDLKPLSATGLIRCPWSSHSSGLHKVPLTHKQLSAIVDGQDVAEIAGEGWKGQFDAISEPMDAEDDGLLSGAVIKKTLRKNHHQMNDMDEPNSVVTCMQKLLLRGPVKGRRHKDSLRVVSNWRRQGIPASFANLMLQEWLGLDEDSPEVAEFRKIIRSVYTEKYAYSCRDEVMSEFCDSKCIFFKKKDYIHEVSESTSMYQNYQDYLDKVSNNGIDLKAAFGFEGSYKILPGEVVIITGDTGAGKSAFAQNLLNKAQRKTLYLNLEMHEALLYRRFLQTEYKMSKQRVNYEIKQGTDFSEALGWLKVLSSAPDVSTLDRLISQDDYRYMVVDTTDGVTSETNSEYKRLGEVVNTLREIAQNKNITVILVHHLRKRDNPNLPITLDELSGNRANVTKMDHVFALEGGEQKKKLRSLKTRDSAKIELPFTFEYQTFTYKKADYEPDEQHTSIRLGTS